MNRHLLYAILLVSSGAAAAPVAVHDGPGLSLRIADESAPAGSVTCGCVASPLHSSVPSTSTIRT